MGGFGFLRRRAKIVLSRDTLSAYVLEHGGVWEIRRVHPREPQVCALYIGITGDLLGRVITHREELLPGFTARYHIHRLVYAEFHIEPGAAIWREKQLKKWRRAWKIELIEKSNPEWLDLFEEIVG